MPTLSALRSQLDTALTFRRTLDSGQFLRTAAELPVRYALGDGTAGEPLAVNLLITLRCNLRCTMCDYAEVLTDRRNDELSVAEVAALARSFKGKPSFFFSGGEPFVRNDLVECMRAVKDAGLKVGTITNGLRLDEPTIEALAELDIETLIFSLHGDREAHDAVVGRPGAHRKLLDTIERFCRARRTTQVLINCAVNERNVDRLEAVVHEGLDAGADRVRFEQLVHLTPGELDAHRRDVAVHHPAHARQLSEVNTYVHEPDAAFGLGTRVTAKMRELEAHHPGKTVFKPHLQPSEVERWYQPDGGVSGRSCFFVWTSAFIDPWGNVTPCQFYPRLIMGNIREQTFQDVYNGPEFRKFRLELREGLFGACRRCCKL